VFRSPSYHLGVLPGGLFVLQKHPQAELSVSTDGVNYEGNPEENVASKGGCLFLFFSRKQTTTRYYPLRSGRIPYLGGFQPPSVVSTTRVVDRSPARHPADTNQRGCTHIMEVSHLDHSFVPLRCVTPYAVSGRL